MHRLPAQTVSKLDGNLWLGAAHDGLEDLGTIRGQTDVSHMSKQVFRKPASHAFTSVLRKSLDDPNAVMVGDALEKVFQELLDAFTVFADEFGTNQVLDQDTTRLLHRNLGPLFPKHGFDSRRKMSRYFSVPW